MAVDVCNTRGHSVSCKMQRKSCTSHFFPTETSNAENKATVYLIFLPTCLQEFTRGHHLIFIHGTLPLNLGLNMYETDTPTLPSLLSILKNFPVWQYVQDACDTEGNSISLCVCSFLEHNSDPTRNQLARSPISAGKEPAGSYDRCDQ